jgi:serine protease
LPVELSKNESPEFPRAWGTFDSANNRFRGKENKMKRVALLVLLSFPSFASFAAEITHPYLVGTHHASREAIGRLRAESAIAGRNLQAYDIIDGYRADLTDDEAAALRESAEVKYIEPDIQRHALDMPHSIQTNELRSLTGQTTPYGVKMVHAPEVWPVTHGANINVAVIDTGIDVNHPDLQVAYAGGFNTYFGDPKYPNEPQAPIDDFGHGTHVAGTIAATDNNIGVVGVASGVRLWAVRVLRSDGKGSATGSTSNVISGIQWVVQQKRLLGGNWIISMSLGSCSGSISEQTAITNAVSAGVLVIAAAGNHDPTQPDQCTATSDNFYEVDYPAAYPGVVAVAAVDSTMAVADFSNSGPEVSLAAPGVNVLSTFPVGTGSIAYVSTPTSAFEAAPLAGSQIGTLTGTFVACGLGATSADFPAAVNGNIAVIERGNVTFATKVKNAQSAGASGVVIYNKDSSSFAGFTLLADPADSGHVWPLAVAISREDGVNLLKNSTATATLANQADDYKNLDGTSMATPHVTGSAALIWSAAPNATANDVAQAMTQTAHDLGTVGPDNSYGYGLVDALAAAKQLNPAAFGAPSMPPPPTGRRPGRRH